LFNASDSIVGRAETFEHTADLGLRIVAASLAGLFESAAQGLFDVIVANREEIRESIEEHLELAAESAADLMLAWLNELIFRSETQHRFYRRFDVRVDAPGCRLAATLWGEPIDADRHILANEVKAATRHGLKVWSEGPDWRAEVILDI
jgi:SHS2 domain-containing protein